MKKLVRVGIVAVAVLAYVERCSAAVTDSSGNGTVSDLVIAKFMLQFVVVGLGLAIVIPLCRKFKQEDFVGETTLGIVLGPTVFGAFAPTFHEAVFPAAPEFSVPLQLFGLLGFLFTLVRSGSEIRPQEAIANGKAAAWLGIGGLVIPAVIGYVLSLIFCKVTNTVAPGGQSIHIVALFMANTMAISAMVIAIRLFNALKINETDIGKTMLCGYAMNSILAWMFYGVLFQMARGERHNTGHTILCLVLGALLTVYCLKWAPPQVERLFKRLAKQRREANIYWFLILIAFGLGALTYVLGFTQYYGVFLGGIVASSSRHVSEDVKLRFTTLAEFVMTPIFFVCIGLYTDFRTDFSIATILFVTVSSITLKYYGARWSAVLAGRPKRELNAIGWSFVPGGVDGIVFGAVALQIGLINTSLLGGIIVSAIVSSVIVAPLLKRAVLTINQDQPKRTLLDYAHEGLGRLPRCDESTRHATLSHVLGHVTKVTRLTEEEIREKLDQMLADNRTETRTDIYLFPEKLAYLHCTLPGLKEDRLFFLWSGKDIDWNGAPVRLVLFWGSPEGFPDITFQARITRMMVKLEKEKANLNHLDGSETSRRIVWETLRRLLSES